MTKRKRPENTAEFIELAKRVHQDKFDYRDVNFTKLGSKVIIHCKTHGKFEQGAGIHLDGSGCKKCYYDRLSIFKLQKARVEFLEKAITVHGDLYDYSKVCYITSLQTVIIICGVHGEFNQSPSAHLSGSGCNPCAISRRAVTKEQFVERAHVLHGVKFDYKDIIYHNMTTAITIRCLIHGVFTQTPHDHLESKYGCRKCADISIGDVQRSNAEEFVLKAQEIHNDAYDYSKVVYKSCHVKVIILCRVHGEWLQTPNSHLAGHGCGKCESKKNGELRRNTREDFLSKAEEKHGDRFNYEQVQYETVDNAIIIVCKLHGAFQQTPYSHLKCVHCCPLCENNAIGDAHRSTLAEFIIAAKKVHGDLYDYSNGMYINAFTKIEIICVDHGSFYQRPLNHLAGNHCQQCSGKGFSTGQLQWLEFIRQSESIEIQDIAHGGEFTIGKYRVDGYHAASKTVFEYHGCFYHGCPQCFVPTRMNNVCFKSYGDLYTLLTEVANSNKNLYILIKNPTLQ